YRSKRRDYVAYEKSVHHFTLFDVDDDKITISAIDLAGRVFDRYELRKRPDSGQDFFAYEIEELKHFLCLAIQKSPHGPVRTIGPTPIDLRLEIPTRFAVRVRGQLKWKAEQGWRIPQTTAPFELDPGQPLQIGLKEAVDAGAISASPRLTLEFEPGKFRNRA